MWDVGSGVATRIGLISNIRVRSESGKSLEHFKELAALLIKIGATLVSLDQDANDADARKAWADVIDDLIAISACPDYVVNRGHYFGTDKLPASEGEPGLSDDDKWALIEFVKTF